MANNINMVCISGRIHDIGMNETTGKYPVMEAKLSVEVGNSLNNGPMYDEMNIRAYNKVAMRFSGIGEGTKIVISGKLKEDLRINSRDPGTVRSKHYINIDTVEVEE